MTTDKRKAGYLTPGGFIATPAGRLSYPALIEPSQKAKTKDGKAKFTTTLLLPPDADLALLKKAAVDALTEQWGAKLADPVFKAKLKNPFLKGEEKVGPEFAGWTVLRMSTTARPGIVSASNAPVSDPEEVYAGRWASILVRAGTYDVDGNKGVSFFIQGVQLLENDDRLAGTANAAAEFAPVEGAATAGGEIDPFG